MAPGTTSRGLSPSAEDYLKRIYELEATGNAAQTGLARPVEFPGKLDEIEVELLNRPGVLSGMLVKPVVPGLTRDWRPGEKVSDLKKQRILLEKAGK